MRPRLVMSIIKEFTRKELIQVPLGLYKRELLEGVNAKEAGEDRAEDHVAFDDADKHVQRHDKPEGERDHLREGVSEPLESVVEHVADGFAISRDVEHEAG